MTEIPKQLQQPGFRFCLIKRGEKRPFEKNWQNLNNYAYDDPKLLEHLEHGGNYGICCGHGNVVVIDIDDPTIAEELVAVLPQTFSVRTGGGGIHLYYIIGRSKNEKARPL